MAVSVPLPQRAFYRVALTGGIASGKSAVSRYFEELGVRIVDADIVARQVVEPQSEGLRQIVEYFGQSLLLSDGSLDRLALRQLIFSNPRHRQWLNQLLHPMIRQRMADAVSEAEAMFLRGSDASFEDREDKPAEVSSVNYVISVIPLLFEGDDYQQFDRIITVDCPIEQQVERVMARDHCTQKEALEIISQQANAEQRRSIASDVIVNDRDLAYLQQQVAHLHHVLLHNFSTERAP